MNHFFLHIRLIWKTTVFEKGMTSFRLHNAYIFSPLKRETFNSKSAKNSVDKNCELLPYAAKHRHTEQLPRPVEGQAPGRAKNNWVTIPLLWNDGASSCAQFTRDSAQWKVYSDPVVLRTISLWLWRGKAGIANWSFCAVWVLRSRQDCTNWSLGLTARAASKTISAQ